MPFEIDGKKVGEGEPCYIVAEIGINHNGDLELAKETMAKARDAGADAVKFQNYHTEDFITDKSLLYEYESGGRTVKESQYEMFKRCELTFEQLTELKRFGDELGISLHSTPTGKRGIEELVKLGCPVLKNGSDYLTHLPLIQDMAQSGLPTVLSTGMASLEEISEAVHAFRAAGNDKLILLICTSNYPTKPENVHLRRIKTLSDVFGCPAGFSDHTDGNTAAIASIVYGSVWLEKHFTLSKDLPGPDHRFSSTPEELRELVKAVRDVESMLGRPELVHSATEDFSRREYRLSCQSIVDLPLGHTLCEKDIAFRRPGTGIKPAHGKYLFGRKLRRPVTANHVFTLEDFE